jgi:hypothetical protein
VGEASIVVSLTSKNAPREMTTTFWGPTRHGRGIREE